MLSPLSALAIAITDWVGNTPLYIGLEQGFFQEEGLGVNTRRYDAVADSLASLVNGSIQGSVPVLSEVINWIAQGGDLRIVAVMDNSVGADAILARNNISSIIDLKGQDIAVKKGGVGHFFLLQVLSESGLSEDAVTIVDLDPETAVAAYVSGNIACIYSFPPYLQKAMRQTDGRIIYDTSKMPTAIVDVYAFRSDFIESNPQAVQAFVNGIFKALDFLKTNPDEAAAIAAEPLEITSDELKAHLKGVNLPDLQTNIEMLNNPQSSLYLPRSIEVLAAFLKSQGQIDSIPDLSGLIDPQFVL